MTAAWKVEIDGNDATAYVKPETVRIERSWGARTGYAEFEVGKLRTAPTYYEQPSLLPGVIAWWHMDEASGNLADASGQGHTLTKNGNPVYRRGRLATGIGGYSIRMNEAHGTANNYFSSTSNDFNVAGNKLTLGIWVRIPAGLTGQGYLFHREGSDLAGQSQFFLDISGAFVGFAISSLSVGADFDPFYPLDGESHFLVVTYDSTLGSNRAKLYIDGQHVASSDGITGAIPSEATSARLDVGGSTTGTQGRIDEAFISDDALSASVISDLYFQGVTATKIIHLQNRSEVVIKAEDGTARFGGYASSVVAISEGALDAGYKATIVGWENRFDTIRITGRWYNLRTDQIIDDIFTNDSRLSSYSLTRVRRGRQLDLYQIADKKLTDVLDQLATYDLSTWFVSAAGTQLVYQPLSLVRHRTWFISDDPDVLAANPKAKAAEIFEPQTDMLMPLSRVYVKGGHSLTDLNPASFDSRTFTLDYDVVPRQGEDEIIVQINLNTGASPIWSTDLDVGRTDRDELLQDGGTKEVLYNPANRTFTFDETAEPPRIFSNSQGASSLHRSWRIFAQKKVSIRVTVRDARAEERLGGVYEDVINDDTILTAEDANKRARLEIRERSKERLGVRFSVPFEIDGSGNGTPLQVGDLIHVINTKRGIDTRDDGDGLQVQRIVSTPRGGGGHSSQHEVYVGYWPRDVLDYQYLQLRRLERIVVDDFFDAEETVNFVDFGYDGDPSETDGVIKLKEPTWAFS